MTMMLVGWLDVVAFDDALLSYEHHKCEVYLNAVETYGILFRIHPPLSHSL